MGTLVAYWGNASTTWLYRGYARPLERVIEGTGVGVPSTGPS